MSPFNTESSIDNMEDSIRTLNGGTTVESGFFAETFSSTLIEILDRQALLQAELDKTTISTEFPDSSVSQKFAMVARLMQTAEARGSHRDMFYVEDGGEVAINLTFVKHQSVLTIFVFVDRDPQRIRHPQQRGH